MNDIGIAMQNFNKSNIKVLAPLTQKAVSEARDFVFLSTDDPSKTADVLEKEFMANIERADFLYVANIGGYIGQSVAGEIALAFMKGVPILLNEKINSFSDEIPKVACDLISKHVSNQLSIDEIGLDKIDSLSLKSTLPISLSVEEKRILQSLVDVLFESLESVKIGP